MHASNSLAASIRDLRKDYVLSGETVHALRGVSFDVPEGDYISIMGPSGSGKSTLLNLLGCLDRPTAGSYTLGGDDGFPGLHIGERRGDREAMVGLALATPVLGPVLARVELAAGRTGTGGGLFADSGWVGGVRAGLGADTPVGPVRFEYGHSTEGRGALFVRLGRWF